MHAVVSTSAATATDTIRAFYDAWQRWDAEAMQALLQPTAVVEQAIGTPWDGLFHGARDSLRCLWRCRQTMQTILTPENIVEAGGFVAVSGSVAGLFRATGTAFSTRYLHLWQVRSGRIARLGLLFDEAAVRAALDEAPPARSAA